MTTTLAGPAARHYKALLRVDDGLPEELLISCPSCKALDVIRFDHEIPIPSRKFTHRAGRFYHDCGSRTPCRLHIMRRGAS